MSYSSSGGDGYLGHGWSLQANSAISRCPQSFAQDGQLVGVSLTSSDKFCLDGQRLVLTAGNYGEANSTYSKEIDDASVVTALGQAEGGGPAAFKVETKSGETHYFGDVKNQTGKQFSDTSGLNNDGDAFVGVDTDNGEVIRLWTLKAIEDNVGNYISFHYNKTATEQYLSSIDYAGHISGDSPYASVDFRYIDNPKLKRGYAYGGELSLTQLLDGIDVTLDGQLQKTYQLTYSTSTAPEDKNYLDSIQACVDSALTDCSSSISFDWTRRALHQQIDNYHPFSPKISIGIPSGDNDNAQVFDMDGDGKADLVYVRDGKWVKRTIATGDEMVLTSIGANKAKFARSIDYNGDGQRDLLVANSDTDSWQIISATPSLFNETDCEPDGNGGYLCLDSTRKVDYSLTSLGRTAIGLEDGAIVADVNGDSLEDILYIQDNHIMWYKNQQGSFASGEILYSVALDESPILQPQIVYGSPDMKTSAAVDVNGDGMTDLLLKISKEVEYCSTGMGIIYDVDYGECVGDLQGRWGVNETSDWHLYISNGSGYDERQVLGASTEVESIRAADINGDGLTDIIYEAYGQWRQRLSDGVQFQAETLVGLDSDDAWDNSTFFVDINGDGRADMLRPSSNEMTIYLSEAGDTTNEVNWVERSRFDFTGSEAAKLLFGDKFGFGRLDMLTHRGSSWYTYTNQLNSNDSTISRITDGLGVKTDIEYIRLTGTVAGNAYKTQGSSNLDASKNFSFIAPLNVVKRVQTATSPTRHVGITYEYGGLLINRLGRGFQGFEMLRTLDEQSDVVTETVYAQLFPQTGLPLATKQIYQGNVLSESSNAYVFTAAPSLEHADIYRRTEMSSLETARQYGSDGITRTLATTTTVNEFDEWGNLVKSTVKIQDIDRPDEEKLATYSTNVFAGSGGGAAKGRLSRATVVTYRYGDRDTYSGRQNDFSYYDNGLLKDTILAANSGAEPYRLTTTKVYDKYGNTTEVSITGGLDTEGAVMDTRSSSTQYDIRGRFVKSTTNAVGDTATNTYNGQSSDNVTGRITSATVTDANQRSITKSFDAWGRVTTELNPDGTQTHFDYALCANDDCSPLSEGYLVATQTRAGSPTTKSITDLYGRAVGTKTQGFDGSWVVTATDYDGFGRVSRQYEPAFGAISPYYSEVSYDAFNRITSQTMPNDGTSTRYYQGFETLEEDANGKQKTTEVNILGQKVKVTDERYNTVSFQYDALGNLLRSYVQPSDGAKVLRTSLTYDEYGRKTASSDLDKGTWTYTYNAFGEMLTQKNASNGLISLFYDKLGRKVRRDEGLTSACWVYGSRESNTAGMLMFERNYGNPTTDCNSTYYNQQKSFEYDQHGRLTLTSTKIYHDVYSTGFTYDTEGRVKETLYPNNLLIVENIYNAAGYLSQRIDKASGLAYQTVEAMNARGQVTSINYGNGAQENTTFDSATGMLSTIDLSKGTSLHHLEYQFDKVGNLEWRQHQLSLAPATFAEDYSYDDLYRLYDRTITVSAGGSSLPTDFKNTLSTRYDSWGNIESKTGTGHYRYYIGNPYRLKDICVDVACIDTSEPSKRYTMSYDSRGNITRDSQRIFQYSAYYDAVTRITKGSEYSNFLYDINRTKIQRVDVKYEDGERITYNTHYVGGHYEKVVRTGGTSEPLTEEKLYVGNAVITKRSNDTTDTFYLHKDHQGSTTTITNATGDVVQQFTYDPWGKQTAVFTSSLLSNYVSPASSRGYTGHESLNNLGIIDMNGRIYDPNIGRFMQADPFIQQPDNFQNYNRYSYVLNNPMSYTDPSGFFFDKIWDAIKPFVAVIVTAIAYVYCNIGCGPAVWAAIGGATGALSAAVNGGNVFRGAIIGAVTAGIAGGVADGVEAFIVNGAIGGIASVVQGGEFGNGFVAAGFSSLAGGVIGQINNPVGKVVTRGIIGGTISEVTGGKFANGASSAAFAQIIGDLSDYAMSESSSGSDRKNQVPDWSQADEDWLQETMVQTAIDLENGDVYALGGQMLQERDMLDSEFGPGTYMNVMEDAGETAIGGALVLYGGGYIVFRGGYRVLKSTGFRYDGMGRWKANGTWQEGRHFHLGTGGGLDKHHLPQQFGNWWRNFKSLTKSKYKGWKK